MANDIGVVPSEATRAQTATTAEKKIAHLISCLSKDVYATLKSLCLPDSPADRTYKYITNLLKVSSTDISNNGSVHLPGRSTEVDRDRAAR